MLKDFFYTGLGIAAIMKEKVEEELKEYEKKGKIKKEDAQKIIDSLEKKGHDEEKKIHDSLKKAFKEIIDELGLATKKDIEKLKEDLK